MHLIRSFSQNFTGILQNCWEYSEYLGVSNFFILSFYVYLQFKKLKFQFSLSVYRIKIFLKYFQSFAFGVDLPGVSQQSLDASRHELLTSVQGPEQHIYNRQVDIIKCILKILQKYVLLIFILRVFKFLKCLFFISNLFSFKLFNIFKILLFISHLILFTVFRNMFY